MIKGLDWINPEDYSFNSFLLLERFQIRLMMESGGWRNDDEDWRHSMGVALNANPAVKWYFVNRCPECLSIVNELTDKADVVTDAAKIREAEIYALISVDDFIIHTTPKLMGTNCSYIRDWNKERLYELADFKGKTVLDIGAGSGRLTFAAAAFAKEVYAVEPVGTLREYLREKAEREGITNVRVTEALVTSIPYLNNTFDIVMSGHVVGDDFDAEISEMTRVCKPGGWLLDCPGDETTDRPNMKPNNELIRRGWEEVSYAGIGGGTVYQYRKQKDKE